MRAARRRRRRIRSAAAAAADGQEADVAVEVGELAVARGERGGRPARACRGSRPRRPFETRRAPDGTAGRAGRIGRRGIDGVELGEPRLQRRRRARKHHGVLRDDLGAGLSHQHAQLGAARQPGPQRAEVGGRLRSRCRDVHRPRQSRRARRGPGTQGHRVIDERLVRTWDGVAAGAHRRTIDAPGAQDGLVREAQQWSGPPRARSAAWYCVQTAASSAPARPAASAGAAGDRAVAGGAASAGAAGAGATSLDGAGVPFAAHAAVTRSARPPARRDQAMRFMSATLRVAPGGDNAHAAAESASHHARLRGPGAAAGACMSHPYLTLIFKSGYGARSEVRSSMTFSVRSLAPLLLSTAVLAAGCGDDDAADESRRVADARRADHDARRADPDARRREHGPRRHARRGELRVQHHRQQQLHRAVRARRHRRARAHRGHRRAAHPRLGADLLRLRRAAGRHPDPLTADQFKVLFYGGGVPAPGPAVQPTFGAVVEDAQGDLAFVNTPSTICSICTTAPRPPRRCSCCGSTASRAPTARRRLPPTRDAALSIHEEWGGTEGAIAKNKKLYFRQAASITAMPVITLFDERALR